MPENEQKSESTDLTTTTKHLNQKESIVTVPGPRTNFLPGNAEGKKLLGVQLSTRQEMSTISNQLM